MPPDPTWNTLYESAQKLHEPCNSGSLTLMRVSSSTRDSDGCVSRRSATSLPDTVCHSVEPCRRPGADVLKEIAKLRVREEGMEDDDRALSHQRLEFQWRWGESRPVHGEADLGSCDIFTCTLVTCFTVSPLHLRTLPQGP